MSIHGRRAFVSYDVWRATDQPLLVDAVRYWAVPADSQFMFTGSKTRPGFEMQFQHPSFPAYPTWADVPEEIWDRSEEV